MFLNYSVNVLNSPDILECLRIPVNFKFFFSSDSGQQDKIFQQIENAS